MLRFVIRRVNELRRDAKATKDFDREMAKIVVPSKDRTDTDEQRGVDGSHYYDGANPIGPGAILKTAFNSQTITHSRSDNLKDMSPIRELDGRNKEQGHQKYIAN